MTGGGLKDKLNPLATKKAKSEQGIMTGWWVNDKLNPLASKKSEIRTSLNDRFGGGIINSLEVYQ